MHAERRHRARKVYKPKPPTAGQVAEGAKTAGDVLDVVESIAAFIPGVGGAIALGAKGAGKVADEVEKNAKKLERIARRTKAAGRRRAHALAKKAKAKHGKKVDAKAVAAAIKAKTSEGASTDEAAAAVAVELDIVEDGAPAEGGGGGMLAKLSTPAKVGIAVVGLAVVGKIAKVW